MAGSKEFRDKIEERKGTEWYDSALKVGELHDPRIDDNGGKQMYSGAEIRAEMRHGRGDMSTEELTKKYEDMYASGEINLNGNAKDFLKEHHGATLVRNSEGVGGSDDGGDGGGSDDGGGGGVVTPIPQVEDDVEQTIGYQPPNYGVGSGTQIQNVNQDNDIYSTVTGDNNTVTNTQNNSVNQYGAYGTSDRAKMLRDKYVADVSRFVRA